MAIDDNTKYAITGEQIKDLALRLALSSKTSSGEGSPKASTEGELGQFYVNTETGDIYYVSEIVEESGEPTSYVWEKIITPDDISTMIRREGGYPTSLSSGEKGQLWEDASTGDIYVCTKETSPYEWQKLVDSSDLSALIKQNAGTPTTSTVGTKGQLIEDTTNGKLYICAAVSGNTYTWLELGSGGGGDGGVHILTPADYNYKPSNPSATTGYDHIAPWKLDSGYYRVGSQEVAFCTYKGYNTVMSPGVLIGVVKGEYKTQCFYMPVNGKLIVEQYATDGTRAWGYSGEVLTKAGVIDNLIQPQTDLPLSANQGIAINNKIEGRVKVNAGAPTTSTVGTVGALLEDTTNGKLYICTAIIPGTDPDPDTYTWEEVGSGGGGGSDVTSYYVDQDEFMAQSPDFHIYKDISLTQMATYSELLEAYKTTGVELVFVNTDISDLTIRYNNATKCTFIGAHYDGDPNTSCFEIVSQMISPYGYDANGFYKFAIYCYNYWDGQGPEDGFSYFWQDLSRADVVQSTGNSTTAVMSQKAVTDSLNGRVKTNAGAPTTSTAGTKGQLLEDTTNGKLYICTDATNPYVWQEIVTKNYVDGKVLSGSSAPTNSTVGSVGQLYTDTTHGTVYVCTGVIEEPGQPTVYTWAQLQEQGGGASIFTTNEWNALWA